jgi:hypothetical protein
MNYKLVVCNNQLLINKKHFDEYLNNFDFNENLYNIYKKKNPTIYDNNISMINISYKEYRRLFKKN